MVTLADLTEQFLAEDPERLCAEVARLTRENKRLTDLVALFADTPVRVAWEYTRAVNGLPKLGPA